MAVSKEPRINLLRYQWEEEDRESNIRFILILGLVALLFIGAMGGTWQMQKQKLKTLKAENQQLQQQVDKLTRSVASADPAKNVGGIDMRSTIVNTLEKQAQKKSKHFQEIYLISIPGITIGKMDVKSDNNFTINAYCSSQTKFIKFLEQLQELEFVKEAKNISSKRNDKTGEVNFNITLVWEEIE